MRAARCAVGPVAVAGLEVADQRCEPGLGKRRVDHPKALSHNAPVAGLRPRHTRGMAAPSVKAQWNEQFTSCWLLNEDDSIFGRLHLRPWWRPGTKTPQTAWAIEWRNPASDDPPMFVALVQTPGLPATAAEARDDLVGRAVAAKLNGEDPIVPPAGPIQERDWRDIAEGLDRLFSAWVDAEAAFRHAAARDDPAGGWTRWVTLTDAVNRITPSTAR